MLKKCHISQLKTRRYKARRKKNKEYGIQMAKNTFWKETSSKQSKKILKGLLLCNKELKNNIILIKNRLKQDKVEKFERVASSAKETNTEPYASI